MNTQRQKDIEHIKECILDLQMILDKLIANPESTICQLYGGMCESCPKEDCKDE